MIEQQAASVTTASDHKRPTRRHNPSYVDNRKVEIKSVRLTRPAWLRLVEFHKNTARPGDTLESTILKLIDNATDEKGQEYFKRAILINVLEGLRIEMLRRPDAFKELLDISTEKEKREKQKLTSAARQEANQASQQQEDDDKHTADEPPRTEGGSPD